MRGAIKRFIPEGARNALHVAISWPLRQYFRHFPLWSGKSAVWGLVSPHLNWLERFTKARTVFGSTVYVDTRETCGRYIYYFGIWEPYLSRWIQGRLSPGDTFIDIGANVGYYSLLVAKLGGQVVAIEAAPRTFAILQNNLAANGTANVRVVNVAVWDREDLLTMFVAPDLLASTSTLMPAFADQWQLEGRCQVPTAPLSALLEPEEIKSARLIKIDVEGAEWQVMCGMTSVLENCPRNLEVIIEVTHRILEGEGRNAKEVLAFFTRLGFFAYRIENEYSVESYLTKGTAKRPQRINAIPTDTDQVDLIFSRIDAPSL
jgi:FkbM family methyltransferase